MQPQLLRIMNRFDASVPNAPASPDLFNQVVNSGNTHLQVHYVVALGSVIVAQGCIAFILQHALLRPQKELPPPGTICALRF
jgi:hypothetical protein